MKKFFVSQNLVEVESLKEILDQNGILCTIKNQRGSSLAGGVPFVEVFPELWVINDEDYEVAKVLMENWERAEPVENTDWRCSACGEEHGHDFSSCWKCGSERNTQSG